jgi:hypothetical protein
MNDPKIVINKLEALINEARTADTEVEKAAIFGAIRWLIADIEKANKEYDWLLGEKIGRVHWSACALLGYDTDNGHSKHDHFTSAQGHLQILGRDLYEAWDKAEQAGKFIYTIEFKEVKNTQE